MDRQSYDPIQEMVDRETEAWNIQDVEALLDLFHPDMVWAWPPTGYDHDPKTWELEFGRFDRDRWRAEWQTLFDTHELVRNRRTTLRTDLSDEGDGGLAVVDINTLWRHQETGEDFRWKGRTAKIYSLVDGKWKLTSHWGALRFDEEGRPITLND
ncbi:nuclear transport factor 2 family protein [Natronococcus wangiae]|uniref:nuclear transport factor 2 family protein n=1 Tax=Natronococcus wangiae TaxID=3068275 RepID=UPI00273F2A9F|nr:nuclear transport factor 2 family protein [Natronococcus sp. AD5]